MNERERGFAVPEVMIAVVLAVVMLVAALLTLRAFSSALGARSTTQGGTLALEQQLDRMRNDAATAFAVFVPDKDIFGAPNLPAGVTQGDGGGSVVGHEVDFYGQTDSGAETYWAYYYDAGSRTVQRYDYDAARHAGVAARDSGAIDPTGHYAALTGVRTFVVQRLHASELDSSANAFAPLVAQLDRSAGAPRADPVGFVPVSGTVRDDLYGGNTTIQVKLDTDRGSRTIHLATATAPSGFTIHEIPAIRAIVYRINTVHRSWFGVAQKTHAHIYEQLQYSYHPQTDAPSQWKVWCDYELYGAHIAGLSLNDPAVQYQPANYLESTAGVFFYVTSGGYAGLDPQHCSGVAIPSPTQSSPPAPAATDPEKTATPPPCFDAGKCWPGNAPPTWTPPSPWPSMSPPPEWCATHRGSGLCGGGVTAFRASRGPVRDGAFQAYERRRAC